MASVVNGQEINDYLFPQRLEYFVFVIHSHLPSLPPLSTTHRKGMKKK